MSLGGVLKGLAGTVAHAIPGVDQLLGGFNLVKGLVNNPITKPIVTASIPMSVPAWAGSSGGKMAGGGGTVPSLPRLGSGKGGGTAVSGQIFGDVTGGGSTTSPTAGGGGRRPRMTKKGTWTWRRRPRMNPMNVRSLRRAARRLESGEKLFRKVFSMVHHKPAGSVHFKKRRK